MAQQNCCLCGKKIAAGTLVRGCSETNCNKIFHSKYDDCSLLFNNTRLQECVEFGRCPSCNNCCCLCGKDHNSGKQCQCGNFFHKKQMDCCTKDSPKKGFWTLMDKSGKCSACFNCGLCGGGIIVDKLIENCVYCRKCKTTFHSKSEECSLLYINEELKNLLPHAKQNCLSCMNRCCLCGKNINSQQTDSFKQCQCNNFFHVKSEDCLATKTEVHKMMNVYEKCPACFSCCLCGVKIISEQQSNGSVKKCIQCSKFFHLKIEDCRTFQLNEELHSNDNPDKCFYCRKLCCLCGVEINDAQIKNRSVINCSKCNNFLHLKFEDCKQLRADRGLDEFVNKSYKCHFCNKFFSSESCSLCEKKIIQHQIDNYSVLQCRCKKFLHLNFEDCSKLCENRALDRLVNKSLKCPTHSKCSECDVTFTMNDTNIQHCVRCEVFFHDAVGCTHNCKIDEHTLRCLQWNVRGMADLAEIGLKRLDILRNMLHNEDIDIVFLQDLQKKGFDQITDVKEAVFQKYRLIPESVSFGVHFLIRKKKLGIDDTQLLSKSNSQVLSLKIKWNGPEIFVTNFYCSPSQTFEITKLPLLEKEIVAGDFNAHSTLWDKDCTAKTTDATKRGNELVEWMNENHYTCVNDKSEKTFRKEYVKSFLTTPDITFFNNNLSDDIDFHQDSLNWRVIPMRNDHYVIKFDIVKKEQMNLKMTPKLTDTTYQSAENIDTEKKEDKESSLNVKEDNGGKYYCYESSNGKTTEQNEEKITQMISELDLDPQIEEKKVTGNT